MRTLFMLLLAYAGVYAYLSKEGSYQVVAAVAPTSAEVVSVGKVWQPKACDLALRSGDKRGRHTVDGNTLGLVFLPAILIDRQFVHRTQRAI